MESEEGTAFEFLPRREQCRNPSGSPVRRRFDRSQKWQDEFETHSENLTAMEARSSTGASESENCESTRRYPPEARRPDLLGRIFRCDPASGSKRLGFPKPAACIPFSY